MTDVLESVLADFAKCVMVKAGVHHRGPDSPPESLMSHLHAVTRQKG